MKTNRPALRPPWRIAVSVASVTVLLGFAAACGGSSDAGSTESAPAAAVAGSGDDGGGDASAPQEAVPDAENLASATAPNADLLDTTRSFSGEEGQAAPGPEPMQRAVISIGRLHVQTKNLVEARHDALGVVEQYDGTVEDEQSGSDDHGKLEQVDLTLRVPAESFDEAMDELADLGTLRDRSQKSTDVTTEVIDVAARVKAQRQSVESIERLLARAQTIGEIMSVEAQLNRRQAALDSLVQQQKYLAAQTSMSTIHLLLNKPPKAIAEPDEDEDGFLGGLERGWEALGDTAVAVGTAVGAILPFAAVLALLGFPAWLGFRRLRPARPVADPEPGL